MKNDIFNHIFEKCKNSTKIFIIDKNITYGDFNKKTSEYLTFFKKNLRRRENVCICAKYSLEMVCLIFSCCLNNNPVTLLNPNSSLSEKKHIVNDSKSKIIFYESFNNIIFRKSKKMDIFKYSILSKKFSIRDKFIKFLIYTSGTTHKPKGVMISNRAITNNISSIKENLKMKSSDKTIIFSPPAYAMGISQILTAMSCNSSIVFYNQGLKFPYDLLKLIKKYKISILNLSISSFRILKNYLNKKEKLNCPRIVMSGGMQYGINDFNNFKMTFPKAKLINFYGCTENSPRISHCILKKKYLYNGYFPVGTPIKNVKIKILKSKSKNTKYGKIFISGKSLMSGYFNHQNLNKIKFKKKWFETGDLGFFKNKQLYLMGREDNIFTVGHEKLCPEEIESILQKRFKFSDVIILKKKDSILNWHPVCAIKKEKGQKINKTKVLEFCQKNFSSFKIPRKITFLQKIPKTKYGKIDRKKVLTLI